jgi:hypothetical protein
MAGRVEPMSRGTPGHFRDAEPRTDLAVQPLARTWDRDAIEDLGAEPIREQPARLLDAEAAAAQVEEGRGVERPDGRAMVHFTSSA